MTPMQKLIGDRLAEQDLSYRAAAERANGLISHSSLHQIHVGRSLGPWSDKTLAGVALALDVPLPVVKKQAQETHPSFTTFTLPAKAKKLNAHQRRLILEMIDMLLQTDKK